MYPIGIQDFRKLREEGYVYVDKTRHIVEAFGRGRFYFLSRPRRFGKSLMLSTIFELYSGSDSLFEGLWASEHWDFEEERRPVIWLKFSSSGFRSMGLKAGLHNLLDEEAARLGVALPSGLPPEQRLRLLIQRAAAQSGGRRIVLLADEYDKPIVDYLGDGERAEANSAALKTFYSVLKDADPYVHLAVLTGVTAFAKGSIFSDLNHVRNISLDPIAQTLVGWTDAELDAYFAEPLARSEEDRVAIRQWYNGYAFGGNAERVYNPWSLLNYFASGVLENYWYETGTPAWLARLMHERGGAPA